MWGTERILVLSMLLGAAWAASDPLDFSATIEMIDPSANNITCLPRVKQDQCDICKAVCAGIFQCLETAEVSAIPAGSSLPTTFTNFGLIRSQSADPKCKNFVASSATPSKLAQTIDPQASPGSFVVPSVTSRIIMDQAPLTTFIQNKFYTNSRVEGNIVAQCDGLTLYAYPGGFCDCSAEYRVVSGKVMGVDAAQPSFDTSQGTDAKKLGTIYGLRVKQNPSLEDFQACNATFMGSHIEQGIDGKFFNQSCFRKFEVQQSQVSVYKQTVCGSQLLLFNQGAYQNETTCRDGVGVINADGTAISGTPAGVFFHREPERVSPVLPDGTPDDPQWFFSLTPSKLPLNASAQLDMQLTLLTGPPENRTQLTCIAEYKVDPLDDPNAESLPILGFSAEPMKQPDSASSLAFAAVLLLPTLLLLF